MPTFSEPQGYKTPKPVAFEWATFSKGLNTLLKENEIDKSEMAQAENIILKGRGVPTKRWGTALYFDGGDTGKVRGLTGYYTSLGTVELLNITDDGFLNKRNNASFTMIAGASWASGYNAQMTQLNDSIYIVNGQRELVRYSLPTLVGFPTIGIPTVSSATNISNASGSTVKSYRVSAVSNVGETLASTPLELRSQPVNLGGSAGGTIRLFITPPSTASGVLQGMNIYGRESGYERFVGSLPGNATVFDDNGSAIPSEFSFPSTADSTGGPIAKYVARFQDRLIFAGLSGEPTKILISGHVPYHERFDLSFGGNYIDIEPDAGDSITQISTFGNRIIVFKERSIWEVTLSTEQIGNYFITTPNLKLITASRGCIAARSVVPVENDLFFLSRDGVYILGYQANYAVDVLRTNEVSAKIRPFFKSLTVDQLKNAVAVYHDFKYLIAFPGIDKTMVFDRERNSWVGPWTKDASVFETFYDADSNRHLLYGNDDSTNIDEYNETFTADSGTAITTTLRTRQEDFGDWALFKNINNLYVQFRNITGQVNLDVRLEKRNGTTVSAENTNIVPNTGNSGWGADLWATALWGTSGVGGGGVDSAQIIKWFLINNSARTMQLTFRTTGVNDNFELYGVKGDAKPISSGYRPTSWRVY